MQVQLHQIAISLAGQSVLSGVELSTKPNEYVVILGPSGCGKTTTLRIIAGLQRPDRGEVLFDGTPVTAISPRQRGVSMVFQHDGLYPHLTVEKSIRLGVFGRVDAATIKSRLNQAAELTRIQGLLDRFPDQLSGGELRRAAVAKAIVRQSAVRLLDEPLSALDASARHLLQDDILRWHLTVPGTTIHVTHDGYEALRMADRVAILDGGRIKQFDSPAKIYHQPCDITVAESIGSPSMNLIRARIEGGRLVSHDPRVRVNIDQSNHGTARDVLVGIRPESLRAIDTQDRDNLQASSQCIEILARLVEVRQGIHQRSVRGELDDVTIHGVVENPTLMTCQSGENILLRASQSTLHLFDATSGLRLPSCPESTTDR